MGDIYIPEHALKDEDEFKVYVSDLFEFLFRKKAMPHFKPALPVDSKAKEEHIEKIMEVVNQYINGDLVPLDYKEYKKNKKRYNRKFTDVINITTIILLKHYDIRYIEIGRILGVHHTTIVYYTKRFDSLCTMKNFKYNYVRLIRTLFDKKLIPHIKLHTKELREINDILDKKLLGALNS